MNKIKLVFVFFNLMIVLNSFSLTEEIINAIKNGDVENVRMILKGDANIYLNEHKTDEITALMMACQCGKSEMVKLLIEKGADVNEKGRFYENGPFFTALEYAVFNGNFDMAKMIIDKGADFNIIVGSLYNRTCGDVFNYSLELSKFDIAKYLVKKGYNVNKRPWNSGEQSYLIYWANRGLMHNDAIDRVKFLIDNGANVNFKDDEGNTALIHAVINNYDDKIITYLIGIGAYVNLKNKKDKTAMDYALVREKDYNGSNFILECNARIINLLKKAGAKEGKYL
jgi:ankyrin repeat protein